MQNASTRRVILPVVAFWALLATSVLAGATTISPNTTVGSIDPKDGLCSLRESFIVANNNAPWGFVPGECPAGSATETDTVLIPAGLYRVGLAIPITEGLNVVGASRGETILDAEHSSHIFSVRAPDRQIFDAVIESMTLRNGHSDGAVQIGKANVLLRNLDIHGTKGGFVGAVSTGSDFPVTTIIQNCWLHDNEGAYGAVVSRGSTRLIVDSSTISHNHSAYAPAGISYFAPSNSPGFVIVNSTISNNESVGGGTAIVVDAPSASLILSSTIVDNHSSAGSGGIRTWSGEILMTNSILAGNQDQEGPSDCTSPGDVVSAGYNVLAADSNCTSVHPTDFLVSSSTIDTQVLADLASNGGPTPTRALFAGSVGIDGGDPSGCIDAAGDPLATDQRGATRPLDGDHDGFPRCDIGAFELVPPDPVEEIAALRAEVAEISGLRGLLTSLLSKLDTARAALIDSGPQNDAAAIGALQAFIHAAEAQREKGLTDDQARSLAAGALAILAHLGG